MGLSWNKENKHIVIGFLCAFLLGMLAAFFNFFPFRHLQRKICIGMAVVWVLLIRKRILDRRMRFFLMCIGLSFILLFILQLEKYVYFNDLDDISRFLWYAYYIPLLSIPLFSVFAALSIGRDPDEKLPFSWVIRMIVCVFLVAGILTNDYHELAFRFEGERMTDNEPYSYGILYLVSVIWIGLLILKALFVIFQRCRVFGSKRYIWVPGLFFGLEVLYSIFFVINGKSSPELFDIIFLQFQEVYFFTMTGLWESCIQIGLIPSNQKYELLFEITSLQAQIADGDGNVIYKQEGAEPLSKDEMRRAARGMILLDGHRRLQSAPVDGGRVYWLNDITAINQINMERRDTADQLNEENVLLEKENQLRMEQAEYEIQNMLYDEIARQLQPKVEEIRRLLSEDDRKEDAFRKRLAYATVLLVYVKRRANLFFISKRSEKVCLEDLRLAVQESAVYLGLMNVACEVVTDYEGNLSAGRILFLYDCFQYTLECAMPDVHRIMVQICPAQDILLSIQLHLPKALPELDWCVQQQEICGVVLCVLREGETAYVQVKRREGWS